jgi:hypothetical protein
MRGTRLRVALLWLAFGPLCSAAKGLTVVDEGTAAVDSDVHCGDHAGRVVVRTGVHFQEHEVDVEDAISMSFQAAEGDSTGCCWVQFVWAEVIATIDSGGVTERGPIGATLSTSGGPVELTTDPAAPVWHVDSAGKSPCYEAVGLGYRDRRGTTIFDRVDNVAAGIGPALAPLLAPATLVRVDASVHFETFLVCDRQVCYTVAWTAAYSWAPAPSGAGPPTVSGPTYTPEPAGSSGGKIRAAQRKAAGAEHPGTAVLPG